MMAILIRTVWAKTAVRGLAWAALAMGWLAAGFVLAPIALVQAQAAPDRSGGTSFAEQNRLRLREAARGITVKVLLDEDNSGSGILVFRQGNTYRVLTNRHVLTAGKRYRVQMADGQVYRARAIAVNRPGQDDLGLLEFASGREYAIAQWAEAPVESGDRVFAVGYPIDDDPSQPPGFTYVAGRVALLSPRPIQGGYQVGVAIAVAKGMSGGPLLDARGRLVGVVGMHQYPLWGNPYVYTDGSLPPRYLREEMAHYSWAIPLAIARPWLTGQAEPRGGGDHPVLAQPDPRRNPDPPAASPRSIPPGWW